MVIAARFEFKLPDMWVGVFWRTSTDKYAETTESEAVIVSTPRLDVWVCFLPCVPLHVVITWEAERSESMRYIDDKTIQEIVREAGWEYDPTLP